MYKHTAIISNTTPFVPSAGSNMPTGKQIRGLFGYVSLDLGLSISNYFINLDDDRVVFKNPYPLGSYIPDVKIYRYGRHVLDKISAVISSKHKFKFNIYTKDVKAANDIDTVFQFLIKTKTFSLGKGRSHGLGRFNIVFYKVTKEKLEWDAVEMVKIDTQGNLFIKNGNNIKSSILQSFSRFSKWLNGSFDTTEIVVKQPSFFAKKKSKINIYIEKTKMQQVIDGNVYSFNDPIRVFFNKPVKLCKNMEDIWGVGDFIQFGYGDFSFL